MISRLCPPLFFLFFFFLSFSSPVHSESDFSSENPCLLNGLDYSGLSLFPDILVPKVSDCQNNGVKNFLFSLCRPLKNRYGEKMNASAVLLGPGGDDQIYGIFPTQMVTTPVYGGNISQGITLKASAGSDGPAIFINLYCWALSPQSEVVPIFNPWLGNEISSSSLSVSGDGKCDALEVTIYTDCVCPGYGENSLQPCSPPMPKSNVSMSFPSLFGNFASAGQNGELVIFSYNSFSHLVPNAFDPLSKLPSNYSIFTFPLSIESLAPKGGLLLSFSDKNRNSQEIYFVMETTIISIDEFPYQQEAFYSLNYDT